MRTGIEVTVTRKDRRRLEAIVRDRNGKQKHVKRATVILATSEGCGTNEIMRRSGLSKPVVWRWQERFMHEGVEGLLRDKTRKPGKAPLAAAIVRRGRFHPCQPTGGRHPDIRIPALNAVETLFATLTRKRLKRGMFGSVHELQNAINRFIEDNNADPKPFVWTADPKKVLSAIERGK